MAEEFPEDVRQFIIERINSVAELEVLLLVQGEPQRVWTAEEVSKALYTTAEMSAAQLDELAARGLLRTTDGQNRRYQYHPATPELGHIVSRLKAIYDERRVSVITLIYSKPVDKVRTFADAFRLRGEK